MSNNRGGPNQRMRDAIFLVEQAGVYERIEKALASKKKVSGRPRGISVKALFVALQVNAMEGKYFLKEVPGVLANLSPSVEKQLDLPAKSRGVSYPQVTRLYDSVTKLLGGEVALFDKDDPAGYAFFDDVFNAIATAGAHAKSKESPHIAIDATDIPSWGTERVIRVKKRDPVSGEVALDKDGRMLWVKQWKSTDPDAHTRGSNDESKKPRMYGFYLTAAVSMPAVGEDNIPHSFVAVRFRPALFKTKEMAVAVAGDAAQRPCGLGDVAVDREYTQSNDGSDFLMPVRALGGKPVFDLKVTQVGPSGTIRGAVIIDGRPYSPSIPQNLQELTPPRGKNDPTGRPDPIALAEYEASIALRKKYALVLHQTTPSGYVFQCPAAAGNIDCTIQQPRRATNKILPLAVNPPSVVAPDSVCAAQFRSFGFEELPHYQEETFGSTEHRLSYRRRGASVEPAFGAIKDFAGEGLQRGKCRVVSTPKTGLFLAFAMASANLRPAQAYDRRQQSMRSSSPANAPADPATRA